MATVAAGLAPQVKAADQLVADAADVGAFFAVVALNSRLVERLPTVRAARVYCRGLLVGRADRLNVREADDLVCRGVDVPALQ